MSEPFLGQILMAGFNFAPSGYHFCDGALMTTQQNAALSVLLGTIYGGDGKTNFNLPDLRSRTFRGMLMGNPPVVDGVAVTASNQGIVKGTNTLTLGATNLPLHTHVLEGSTSNATASIAGNIPSVIVTNTGSPVNGYASVSTPVAMGNPVSTSGGSPHENMQPFLALNFIIAVSGLFPQRQ